MDASRTNPLQLLPIQISQQREIGNFEQTNPHVAFSHWCFLASSSSTSGQCERARNYDSKLTGVTRELAPAGLGDAGRFLGWNPVRGFSSGQPSRVGAKRGEAKRAAQAGPFSSIQNAREQRQRSPPRDRGKTGARVTVGQRTRAVSRRTRRCVPPQRAERRKRQTGTLSSPSGPIVESPPAATLLSLIRREE